MGQLEFDKGWKGKYNVHSRPELVADNFVRLCELVSLMTRKFSRFSLDGLRIYFPISGSRRGDGTKLHIKSGSHIVRPKPGVQ
jgi:hypothetical protein